MSVQPVYVDSHAHLSSTAFEEDWEEVIARARETGLVAIIDVATERDEWDRGLELASTYPLVHPVVGLHPNSAGQWSSRLREELEALLASGRVVGIGETGLDYYRMGASQAEQKEAFIGQLELAREHDLPVVIHGRDAYEDILAILERYGGTRGVMHSYAGPLDLALEAVRLGYYVSISGPVTYKSGTSVRELAAEVPLDRLLVETDSPYLPPHPFRGKRNEPSYVALTAAAVAEVRGMSPEDLGAVTTRNALELFRLPDDQV